MITQKCNHFVAQISSHLEKLNYKQTYIPLAIYLLRHKNRSICYKLLCLDHKYNLYYGHAIPITSGKKLIFSSCE